MTDESKKDDRSQEWAPAVSRSLPERRPAGGGLEMDRLPPPAFPPGSRRAVLRPLTPGRLGGKEAGGGVQASTGEAEESDSFASAIISPDDPFRRRESRSDVGPTGGEDRLEAFAHESEMGVASGLSEEGPVYGHSDPGPGNSRSVGAQILLAADGLEVLAKRLREKGTDALHVGAGTSRFDATLRGLIAGYLAGMEEEGKGTR